jgi:hypothetical protein
MQHVLPKGFRRVRDEEMTAFYTVTPNALCNVFSGC